MDELQPTSGSSAMLPPITLTSEQEDLCKRLDGLYSLYGLVIKPSEMFRGALFAMRFECQSNPDWVAQAANSLREILYPFMSPQVKSVPDKKAKALVNYGAVLVDEKFINELGKLWGQLNDLAHHGATATQLDFQNFKLSDFERLLGEFENTMREALTRQLDIHNELDKILNLASEGRKKA